MLFLLFFFLTSTNLCQTGAGRLLRLRGGVHAEKQAQDRSSVQAELPHVFFCIFFLSKFINYDISSILFLR